MSTVLAILFTPKGRLNRTEFATLFCLGLGVAAAAVFAAGPIMNALHLSYTGRNVFFGLLLGGFVLWKVHYYCWIGKTPARHGYLGPLVACSLDTRCRFLVLFGFVVRTRFEKREQIWVAKPILRASRTAGKANYAPCISAKAGAPRLGWASLAFFCLICRTIATTETVGHSGSRSRSKVNVDEIYYRKRRGHAEARLGNHGRADAGRWWIGRARRARLSCKASEPADLERCRQTGKHPATSSPELSPQSQSNGQSYRALQQRPGYWRAP